MENIVLSVIVSLIVCISVMKIHINILEDKLKEFLDQEEKNFYEQLENVELIVIEVLENRN